MANQEAQIAVFLFIVIAATVVAMVLVLRKWLAGHLAGANLSTLRQYCREAPRDEADKRRDVDLMLRGLVTCILGIAFSPMVLLGIVPLYIGGRRLANAALAADRPGDAEIAPSTGET